MRKKTRKQNRLMKIITAPVRMMSKARDLYVKSLTSYGNSLAMPGAAATGPPLPRSFSAGSSTSFAHDEDYSELVRAASVRRFGHSNEVDAYLQQQTYYYAPIKSQSKNYKVLPKSCSVGMRFMGRIDEDGPSDFDQEAVDSAAKTDMDMEYSRSRSCAAVGQTRASRG